MLNLNLQRPHISMCRGQDTPLALVQGKALLLKNLRILLRRWRVSLLLVLLPAATVAILWGVYSAFGLPKPLGTCVAALH